MRDKVVQSCRNGAKRGKRGFVYVITSEKFIRSLMYGAAIPVVGKGVETIGIAINTASPYDVPLPPLVWITMVGVFVFAFWADEHTDEWRETVEDKTGEETADDNTEE